MSVLVGGSRRVPRWAGYPATRPALQCPAPPSSTDGERDVNSPVSPVQEQRRGKAAQRAAAQRAAADRAAHNRRLQALFGALGGVLAVILLIASAAWSVTSRGDSTKPAAAPPAASEQDPAAGQDPAAQPTGAPAPPKL